MRPWSWAPAKSSSSLSQGRTPLLGLNLGSEMVCKLTVAFLPNNIVGASGVGIGRVSGLVAGARAGAQER